jgi:hypothetical protein
MKNKIRSIRHWPSSMVNSPYMLRKWISVLLAGLLIVAAFDILTCPDSSDHG